MNKIDVFIKELQELCSQYDAELSGSYDGRHLIAVSVGGNKYVFLVINKNEAVNAA